MVTFTKANGFRPDLEQGNHVPVQNDKIAKLVSLGDDFFQQVGLGKIPGMERFAITGHAPDRNAGTGYQVISNLQTSYPYKTVDSILSIVSDSIDDTLLGIGARKVIVRGINSLYQEITEIVDMNGLVPVLTLNSYIFANITEVDDVGSNLSNVGNITFTHTGNIIAKIEPFDGRSQNAIFFIPLGKIAIISKYVASITKRDGFVGDQEGSILFQDAEFGKSFVTDTPTGIKSNGGAYVDELKIPIFVDEKGGIRAIGRVDANNTQLYTRMDIIIADRSIFI